MQKTTKVVRLYDWLEGIINNLINYHMTLKVLNGFCNGLYSHTILQIRYGQDEIEMMLEALDAKDESEPASRKTSVGVAPPWECSSRKASRREEVSVGAK